MCQFVSVLDKLPETTKKKKKKCHFEVGPTLSSSSALCILLTCGVMNKLSLFGMLNICASFR